MNKNYISLVGVAIFGLLSFVALAPAHADAPRWHLTVPNGISFSVGGNQRTHVLHILTASDGTLARTTENQIESGNWSGYVLAQYETRKSYTSATGTWIVPAVTGPSGSSTIGYSSSWVGIGGFCENTNCNRGDGSLIQLGTEADVRSSGATYYAWYEMLPSAETQITGLVVHPHDKITASLQLLPATRGRFGFGSYGEQTWQLSLEDVTTGATWTKDVNYESSELSAEWIEEAPSSNSGILPLANYGTANFAPEAVGGGNPAFTTQNEVIMVNPNGQNSNPSAPDIHADAFNACWGNGTALVACAAPAN